MMESGSNMADDIVNLFLPHDFVLIEPSIVEMISLSIVLNATCWAVIIFPVT